MSSNDLLPCIAFSFSKKKCEEIAHFLSSSDLNSKAEAAQVHIFAAQTKSRLTPTDRLLPQVTYITNMSKRGIAVHHGGMLPILKEYVEILFGRGLIKVLLATETFAMGVNMPARAVIYTSLRKHDGTGFRQLTPGEYTQMAGRAGRRGLDDVGIVMIACFGDEPPPKELLKLMLTGQSARLRVRKTPTHTPHTPMAYTSGLELIRPCEQEGGVLRPACVGAALSPTHSRLAPLPLFAPPPHTLTQSPSLSPSSTLPTR